MVQKRDMNQTTRSDRMRVLLERELVPSVLEIIDESQKHAGHAGARPSGETHYRVKIVSEKFTDMNRVAQHRAVYAVLASEMGEDGGIHALALDTSAPR